MFIFGEWFNEEKMESEANLIFSDLGSEKWISQKKKRKKKKDRHIILGNEISKIKYKN